MKSEDVRLPSTRGRRSKMADRTPNPYDAVENPRAFDGYEKGYAACERDMQRAGGDVEKREKLYRVVEVSSEDVHPRHGVGDIVTAGQVEERSESNAAPEGFVVVRPLNGGRGGTYARLEEVKGEPMQEKSEPVCSVCNDTHTMPFSGRHGAPCTYCPVPCGRCAADNGRRAYCGTTPCACECHVAKCEVVSSGMRGGKPPEEKSGPITFTDSKGRKQTLQCEQSEHEPGGCLIRPATPDDLARAGYCRYGAQVIADGTMLRDAALSRIATALGLPETAVEEEIVKCAGQMRDTAQRFVASEADRTSALARMGLRLGGAVMRRLGVSSLKHEALQALAERVEFRLNCRPLQEPTVTQQFVELLANDIRPHLLPTLAELHDRYVGSGGDDLTEEDWDAIVAAAQREPVP